MHKHFEEGGRREGEGGDRYTDIQKNPGGGERVEGYDDGTYDGITVVLLGKVEGLTSYNLVSIYDTPSP